MSFRNLKRLLPLLPLLLLTGCSPEEEGATTHIVGPPRPGAPTGAAAIGSTGNAKALFVDMARVAGINYRWTIPGLRPLDILQTIGNGCAFLDYDGDGDLDVLLVGTDHVALYKGDGHGHFTDVSRAMGLDTLKGHFLGCAVGDYDNDGFEDVYLSGYRTGLLLHNQHAQRFTDVTQAAGLKPQPWGTSCAWAEIVPGSGRLDLFVGNYVRFGPQAGPRMCQWHGLSVACGPGVYGPEQGVLNHNLGQGRFKQVGWGVSKTSGKVLGAAFADYDRSGRQSLYLANDMVSGDLLRNDGTRLVEVGSASGTAFGGDGQPHGGMGVDWADYDNDGKIDLAVGTFQEQTKSIFHNQGAGIFEDRAAVLGLVQPTPYVTFGVKWLDFDNSGWLGLMITNGQVLNNIAEADHEHVYRQPTLLFRSLHGKRFADLSTQAGPDLQHPIVGRGLAIGDFDNDGRIDALVVDSEGVPLLLHNESSPVGHWLSLKLVGTKSNRDGIGALVTVITHSAADGPTNTLTQTRLCHTDGSYLSASDGRVHVGLGKAAVAETVTVHWPSGYVDTLHNVKADQFLTVHEEQ